jgi:hypothetical protein
MDKFLIAPFDQDSGLQTNVKSWLIPDNAFAQLDNAYVFRGRVRKRWGSRWFNDSQLASRLRAQVGTVGVPNATVPGSVGAIGQIFSIQNQILTVYQLNGAMYATGDLEDPLNDITGTFDTVTGIYSFVIPGTIPNDTPIYWYPSLPIMGIVTYETTIAGRVNPAIVFDTRFAYRFQNNGWERMGQFVDAGADRWQGSDSQFFWGKTYTGATAYDHNLYVTNFNETEPNGMRYLDTVERWNNFKPLVSATDTMWSALILVPFHNRLLAFNTWEGATAFPGVKHNYVNRMRYSALGNPVAADAWKQDIAGQGGGVDLPELQPIRTIEFVKDRMVVYCDESTWELIYTGNYVDPFRFQQINTGIGARSTFSIIPFDKVCLGVGSLGLIACNASNADRIDDAIPQQIFKIQASYQGDNRVYGIRDYRTELVYWAYPDETTTEIAPYPNKILIYNYKTNTWALFDDRITAFGYHQIFNEDNSNDVNWDSTTVTWNDVIPWGTGSLRAKVPDIIIGNQQGYVYLLDEDQPWNASVFQITNMSGEGIITSMNHSLLGDEFISFEGITGTDGIEDFNDGIFEVNMSGSDERNTFVIRGYDPETREYIDVDFDGMTYSGGGTYSLVSRIDILTKDFSFYQDQGMNSYVEKIDFYIDSTADGKMKLDPYVSTKIKSITEVPIGDPLPEAVFGNSTLITSPYINALPPEKNQQRLWHPVYLQADGQSIQVRLWMTDEIMFNALVRTCDFQLHAMIFNCQPTSLGMR